MKILLPISLDRWRNPISTLQRACVQFNPDIEFHSFSNPETVEDRQMGAEFWKLPNLRLRKPSAIFWDRFDIVHTASYSRGNHYASIIAKVRGHGSTTVLNTMNLEVKSDDPCSWRRYQSMLKVVDYFVAVSSAVADCLIPDVGERFIKIIPNGFDSSFLDPTKSCINDLPNTIRSILPNHYVLSVAAIEPRKRYDIILELANQNPEVKFVAAGQICKNICPSLLRDLQSKKNIHLLGSVSRQQLRALYSFAAVMAFPSDREGLPLAVIEALGMGLPVVCQPKSSMPELVADGENGRLIDVKNIEEWSKALKDFVALSDKDRAILSAKLREDACTKYEWSNIGKSYGAIYRQITNSTN